MRKILWVGDAVCDSGFARCTHRILEPVLTSEYKVEVLGINYRGEPHDFPFKIWPARLGGGDFLGHSQLRARVESFAPDIVVIQNDPWNVPGYLDALDDQKAGRPLKVKRPKLVGFMAVDSKNVRPTRFRLNELDHVIFWCEFARTEAVAAGLTVPSSVIPLGVDTDLYTPGDKLEARRKLNFPEQMLNAFVVGNVNRNQPRKRLDLTIRYVAEWIRKANRRDVYLYLHVCPTGDWGIDCNQLANYYGLNSQEHGPRLFINQPDVYHGIPEAEMVETFRAFDVQINSALGEGWGLTTMEGMACGIPQIVPDWAALGEWPTGAAAQIPCEEMCFPTPTNQIGGVMDRVHTVNALESVYLYPDQRAMMVEEGLKIVRDPKYRWTNIARKFAESLETV